MRCGNVDDVDVRIFSQLFVRSVSPGIFGRSHFYQKFGRSVFATGAGSSSDRMDDIVDPTSLGID